MLREREKLSLSILLQSYLARADLEKERSEINANGNTALFIIIDPRFPTDKWLSGYDFALANASHDNWSRVLTPIYASL